MTQERSVSTVFAALDRDEIESLRAENARLKDALKGLRDWCDENINGAPLIYSQRMEAADAALKVQP